MKWFGILIIIFIIANGMIAWSIIKHEGQQAALPKVQPMQETEAPQNILKSIPPTEQTREEASLKPFDGQQIWIAPNLVAQDYDKIFLPGAEWSSVKRKTHVFKFYIDNLQKKNEATLRNIVTSLNDAQIAIGVEAGGVRDWQCSGALMAEIEHAKMAPLLNAGGNIHFIVMDSPFGSSLAQANSPCKYSIQQSAKEAATYVRLMKGKIPGVKIGWIEAVPWYTAGQYTNHQGNNFGDLREVFSAFMTALQQEGTRIDFFHVDSPYSYNERTPNGWEKLKALQDFARGYGLRFGVIFNSEEGGQKGDKRFYTETLQGIDKFAAAGGAPDDIIIQSWYTYPALALPETQPYTFMYLVQKATEAA